MVSGVDGEGIWLEVGVVMSVGGDSGGGLFPDHQLRVTVVVAVRVIPARRCAGGVKVYTWV